MSPTDTDATGVAPGGEAEAAAEEAGEAAPKAPEPAAGDAAAAAESPAAPAAGSAADEFRVAVERLPGSRVSLKVDVPPAEVDEAVERALRRLAQRVRIPGFRPGRAPTAMVERAVGRTLVTQEVLEREVPRFFARALEQAGVTSVGEPELDLGDLARGTAFSFGITVGVRPQVDLGDYRALRVEMDRAEITDEQIDKMLEDVRRRHAELVEVDRPAQIGDVLRATLVMRRGEEAVGGSDAERDLELDPATLLDGLAEGLVGAAAGSTLSVVLTLPDDHPREELRGAEVDAEVSVRAVRERRLPPLDDSLAVLDGHGETVDELRDHYVGTLRRIMEHTDDQRYEAMVLERLRETASVEVPEAMIEREIDRELREMEMQLAKRGLRLDRYLEYSGETMAALRESKREAAGHHVRNELVLEALAEAEGIEVDEREVEREEIQAIGSRKVNAEQRRAIHRAAHADLLLRGAAQRAVAIARGEG